MPIDAFVLRYEDNQSPFYKLFLDSPDFDIATLKRIAARQDGTTGGRSRDELVSYITRRTTSDTIERTIRQIAEELVLRRREWLSVKTGVVRRFPECEPARKLVLEQGDEKWYGPVITRGDSDGTHWYIRPLFVNHWEIDEYTKVAQPVVIRWLCFARLTSQTISLHWRGFTHAETQKDVIVEQGVVRNSQFPYWNHVPQLFEEIEELTRARVEYINLHDLILHQLWAEYIDNAGYDWRHRRIRAESGGVSLSAHAGGVVEVNFEEDQGILNLASTIRKAVESELQLAFKIILPSPRRFDDVILRTIIKGYGSLSYEFSLQEGSAYIFRAHSYFGFKEYANSPDRFPHMKVYISQRSDLEQLSFLLEFLRSRPSHENFETQPLPLF